MGAPFVHHVLHPVMFVRSAVQAGDRPGDVEHGISITPVVDAPRRHVQYLNASLIIRYKQSFKRVSIFLFAPKDNYRRHVIVKKYKKIPWLLDPASLVTLARTKPHVS